MRYLSDKMIDEITNPYVLAERIKGFADKMDGIKELRTAYTCEVSKYTGKTYEGWDHLGSIPSEIMSVLYQVYTPEELCANGGELLRKYIRRNKEYSVNANL